MQVTELSSHSLDNDAHSLKSIPIVEKNDSGHFRKTSVRNMIKEQVGEDGYHFIIDQINLENDVFLSYTGNPFNIDLLKSIQYAHIINLKNLNDVRGLNNFFRSVNAKLPIGGLYINCVETFDLRREKIMKMLPKPFNRIIYAGDVLFSRVLPKLKITKKIYFFITRGKGRVLSKTEILGRLYYCGFEVIAEQHLNGCLYFAAKKVKEPISDKDPHYGMVIRLKRVGKDGEIFTVYKLRTMHAYSEYLQQYVFERNQLQEGGKFHNDFRISPEGKFFRKFWLDELPMFINFFKGDMKLVGIRPLSQHYFNLYTPELQKKRVLCKPGLIPPFYADMPKTLDEIMASEMRYLDTYLKNPLKTDISYFFKAFKSILFKGARSK
jgi:lipopolysaccharide/colanic/teichoic acid biosynthesis glycosyltransferase